MPFYPVNSEFYIEDGVPNTDQANNDGWIWKSSRSAEWISFYYRVWLNYIFSFVTEEQVC